MTASKTATIETLTAEVRVLMVGSRQVTLSVYGQLDYAGDDEIEPFGRVMPKDAQAGFVYVIGKRAGTGALARSYRPVSDGAVARQLGSLERQISKAEGQADTWQAKAASLRKAAGEARKRAVQLLGDDWSSARHHDQGAIEADAKAEAAETEVERLESAASAADHRARAAKKRAEAEAAQGEAEDGDAQAAECDRQAEAWREKTGQLTTDYDLKRQAMQQAGAEWDGLPLIVLAGLR